MALLTTLLIVTLHTVHCLWACYVLHLRKFQCLSHQNLLVGEARIGSRPLTVSYSSGTGTTQQDTSASSGQDTAQQTAGELAGEQVVCQVGRAGQPCMVNTQIGFAAPVWITPC
jgi:hypothetical protein